MTIKTPEFWYRPDDAKPGFAEQALIPFSALYKLGREIHVRACKPEKFSIPVLCVGNINAGGAGKTPAALALMDIIKKYNLAQNPFFVSRGYGGGEFGPLVVDPKRHASHHTGDESLILAATAPTIVSARRPEGIRLAASRNAGLALMDDGLQNPHIKKDISFVVINGDMGFGNGKTLPAGPLREPLERGLERADAFILIGADKRNTAKLLPPGKPVFKATLRARENLPPGSYVAFAGLGYPEKFFSFLCDDQKINPVETISYPDHHAYTEDDVRTLQKKAAAQNAELLTTEKDYMRLSKLPGLSVRVLRVKLEWDAEPALAQFLKSRLAAA